MPIPLLATLALAKAGLSGGKFLLSKLNKPKKFGKTAEGKRLKRLSEKGAFGGSFRSAALSRVGREAGSVAQRAGASLSGRLAASGIGDSIASERAKADIALAPAEQVARTSEKLDIQNQLSKEQAKAEFAAGETATNQARRQHKAQSFSDLLGGLGGAATGFIGGKIGEAKTAAAGAQKLAEIQAKNIGKQFPQITKDISFSQAQNLLFGTPEKDRDLIGMSLFNLFKNDPNKLKEFQPLFAR